MIRWLLLVLALMLGTAPAAADQPPLDPPDDPDAAFPLPWSTEPYRRHAPQDPTLEPRDVRAVVIARQRSLDVCLDQEGVTDRVALRVRANIGGDGLASEVDVTGGPSSELRDCVAQHVRMWVFPARGTATFALLLRPAAER